MEAPDLTCAACRRAVFRFSFDESANEPASFATGGERPVSFAEGTSVHELGS